MFRNVLRYVFSGSGRAPGIVARHNPQKHVADFETDSLGIIYLTKAICFIPKC